MTIIPILRCHDSRPHRGTPQVPHFRVLPHQPVELLRVLPPDGLLAALAQVVRFRCPTLGQADTSFEVWMALSLCVIICCNLAPW